MAADALDFLQRWYAEQCNGDWEHEFGVRLATLDNPGWVLSVDLVDTDLEGRELARVKQEPEPDRRLWSASDGELYQSSCDTRSLPDMLTRFRDFAEGRLGESG